MASTTLDLLAPVHRLSLDDYRRTHEVGLFDGTDLRFELIEGIVVEMSPIGRAHERAVIWLMRTLDRQLDDTRLVSPQNSIVLAKLRSLTQPDITIRTRAEVLEQADDQPLLVIEVADSSLRFDRITKSRLYASHGIADYWIVNVEDEAVEVHRDPTRRRFGLTHRAPRGRRATSAAPPRRRRRARPAARLHRRPDPVARSAATTRASFCARGRRLMRASSRMAAERSGCGSVSTTSTGRRERVYREAVPAAWAAKRLGRSFVQPV